MTDYKYLKDNNLFEAHMKFMRAIGESFGYSPLEEADDDPNNQEQGAAPGGDMGGGMPPAPGGDAMGGGAPGGDMGGDMPPTPDAGGAPGGDMGGGMPPAPEQMDGQDPMGGGMPPAPEGMEGGLDEEEPEEEEDVIDVDDLTKAQEKVNDKVNSVGRDLGVVDDRIEKLIGAIENLQGMFDKNNQEISDLKAEFEKRNPTQIEKLNLRSLKSFPFGEYPSDYWQNKEATSNYSAYSDNEEPTSHEYVITNNDVDDFNEREISDSFAVADELDQNIKKIFGL